MYKIMIGDDEGIVIDSVRFIIEKEFAGQCEIQFAKSGRSLIELAESFRPDIAIMDIQMPGINGINAMKEIRKNNKNVIFIVMSAYDKFDYAQESISLGVLDYITKPMDKNRMVNVLKKAMELVTLEKDKRTNDLIVREKLETVIPVLESGLIYDILFHEYFSEDIDNYKNLLEIDKEYGYMLSVVCGEEREGSHMTNAVGSSVRMMRNYQEIRQYLKEYYACIVGTLMANKIAVLVPYTAGKIEYTERAELIEHSRELTRKLRTVMDMNVRIGIGSVHPFKEVAKSYGEAVNALLYTTGSVAHADDLPLNCQYSQDYPIELEDRLFERIAKGETEKAIETADDYFLWMEDKNIDDVKLKILEFVIRAETIAYQNGGMVYSFDSRRSYLPEINSISETGRLKHWFVEKIRKASENVVNKRAERGAGIIENAKEYIRNNFAKNLSLEDVSRIVNISPYYFSRIFKEDTGENFIDYLTSVRIEKAKEMLDTTDSSMKEICVMVGYSDPNYFSRSFKKRTGVTPTEYKEGICNES